jgi:hypothetical protein
MYVKTVRIGRKALASRSARPAESAGSEFEKKRKDMFKDIGAAVRLASPGSPGRIRERKFFKFQCTITCPRLSWVFLDATLLFGSDHWICEKLEDKDGPATRLAVE